MARTVTSAAGPIVLRATRLRKVYGGTAALASGDLVLRAGEVHALLGENGAGKSTLVRLISGVENLDSGRLEMFGVDVTAGYDSDRARALGLGVIHQQYSLAPDLSVAENIAWVSGYQRRIWISWTATRRAAAAALAVLDVRLDPEQRLGDLPPAQQAMVAIARALATRVRVLVLDEVTASLTPHESRSLFAVVERLRDSGVAVLLISHRLEDVAACADRITVLRDGRTVHTAIAADITVEAMITHILGTETSDGPAYVAGSAQRRTPVLEVDGLTAPGLRDVSLQVHAGEILGLTGLTGAGQHVIARLLFGRERRTAGVVRLHSRAYDPATPAAAIDRGVGYLPGDRNAYGLFAGLSVRENLFACPPRAVSRPISRGAERKAAHALMEQFAVRPHDPDREIGTLSGGNAQKVLLGRWLARPLALLMLEDPTTGVDIGARRHIHAHLRAARDAGSALLLISSDVDELALLCDRVGVLGRGRLAVMLSGTACTAHSIAEAAHAA